MSIMLLKRKKYRFLVECTADELTAVPYLNAILFAKLRLLEGGTFSEESPRLEVRDHSVRWHKKFSFQCKMTANSTTGVLDPCHCRISIRREAQGGKSCHKLGFVDLNLASFAGQGASSQRFLLEGYRQNHRQDNSILRVTVNMQLVCGDPCFKPPKRPNQVATTGENLTTPPQDGGASPSPESSPVQPSRAFIPQASDNDYSSLPRRQTHPGDGNSTGGSSADTPPPSVQCPLYESKLENYLLAPPSNEAYGAGLSGEFGNNGNLAGQAVTHQRQGSSDSGHLRNQSSGSSYCDSSGGSLKDRGKRSSHKNALNAVDEGSNTKMDSTRVDPEALINQLILSTKLSPSMASGLGQQCSSPQGVATTQSSGPDSGVGIEHEPDTETSEGHLQLVIGRDGVPVFSSKDSHGNL